MTISPGRDPVGRFTGIDTHAGLATVEDKFGGDLIAGLRVVTFVRNPYTHAYSLYQHMRRNPTHRLHMQMQQSSFPEMIRNFYLKRGAGQRRHFRERGSDDLRADFVGRFELIEEDALALGAFLALPRPLRISHLNAAPEGLDDLETAFGDAREEFAAALTEEFEVLGYSTDIARAYEPPRRSPTDRLRP